MLYVSDPRNLVLHVPTILPEEGAVSVPGMPQRFLLLPEGLH